MRRDSEPRQSMLLNITIPLPRPYREFPNAFPPANIHIMTFNITTSIQYLPSHKDHYTLTDNPNLVPQFSYHNYYIAGYFRGMYILRISRNKNFHEDCTHEVATLSMWVWFSINFAKINCINFKICEIYTPQK